MRAENQIAAAHESVMPSRLAKICQLGTCTSVNRIGITMGADTGSNDITTAIVLCGANATGCRQAALSTSSITTGVAACCASDSLFTVLPTAA